MATKQTAATPDGNTQKDPTQWTTGNEPMTGAQRSYLETLSEETGVKPADVADLTKAEASMKIDELRQKSPRVNESDGAATKGTKKKA
ncbi:MAG TPA: DUF3072 domain-containing protein [Tepidisphaeraceae bacterium]|jgi:hypothetical protein